ncbi:hypothetical protein [uncultured Faecalibaculum sp.]|uniref:hypothetical protein n=1 Tax=uncultured Faecalibaculum sp. TaxID=1729681 RepID=UPI0026179988|nr:hypothetical protein [uncultured Faecalibaculum sp.]
MAFRQRLTAALCAGLLLAGCSQAGSSDSTEPKDTQKEPAVSETTRILTPTGAPALGVLFGTLDNPDTTVEYTEGTDLVTAELAKKDGDYDVIVAPVNLGLKAYSASGTYKCAGVLTWGNLYMIGTGEDSLSNPETEVALFGESAIPGMVYNAVEAAQVQAQPSWYPSVAEASQSLLSGQSQSALLAEPAASAAMAKNSDLKILADLQELWYDEKGTDQKGYPQAALFVKDTVSDDFLTSFQEALSQVSPEDAGEEMVQEIDNAGADKLGVPNAQIAVKSWARQNIRFVPAKEAAQDIETFLDQLGMKVPENVLRTES